MTDRVLLLIAGSCILLALTLASCGDRERQFAEKAISPTAEKAMFLTEYAHVCGSSLRRQDFCPTDFERLAVSPISADGKKVWILGYLAIDNGQVVIFATEEDFLDLQYGRSISVHGSREQLVKLFSEFGYKKVRISGQFRANRFESERNDRLGELSWPISAKLAVPRTSIQGVESIKDL